MQAAYANLRHDLNTANAVAMFLRAKQASKRSPRTIETYATILRKFRDNIGAATLVKNIQPIHVIEFLADNSHLSGKRLRNYHTALSSLWSWLLSNELVDQNIIKQVQPPKVESVQPQPYSPSDVSSLCQATYQMPWVGSAFRAILYLTLDTGIRASEVCALQIKHMGTTTLLIKSGKGAKDRTVPVSKKTKEQIKLYHAARPTLRSNDYVFVSGLGNQLTRGRLLKYVHKAAHISKVPGANFHRLRHTFATTYLRNGGNLKNLQRILGHSDIKTTEKYLHLLVDDLVNVHEHTSAVNLLP